MAVTLGSYTQTVGGETLSATVIEIVPGQAVNGYTSVHYKRGNSKFTMISKEAMFEKLWTKVL